MDASTLALSLAALALGATGTMFLAISEQDPTAIFTGLALYGPLGVVTAWLLWRAREREREHAIERRESWGGVSELRDEFRIVRDVLIEIREQGKRRDP